MLLSDVWRLTSVCLWRTSGLSREQRGIGRQNWHSDSPRHMWLGHHFQGQKVKGQGHEAALLSAALTRKAAGCSGQRGNVFGVGKYCYVASARRRAGAWAPTGEERGGAYCVATRTACLIELLKVPPRLPNIVCKKHRWTCRSIAEFGGGEPELEC